MGRLLWTAPCRGRGRSRRSAFGNGRPAAAPVKDYRRAIAPHPLKLISVAVLVAEPMISHQCRQMHRHGGTLSQARPQRSRNGEDVFPSPQHPLTHSRNAGNRQSTPPEKAVCMDVVHALYSCDCQATTGLPVSGAATESVVAPPYVAPAPALQTAGASRNLSIAQSRNLR